ncbi:biopolymer transporter ExbD [soil metagenome]
MAFGGDGSSSGGQIHEINDINITPFVDVVLVLLVIFMVTAPMLMKDSIKVKLPSSKVSDGRASTPLAIAITAQGQIIVDGNVLTEEALAARVSAASQKDPETSVILAADKDSRHGDVVRIIGIVKLGGLNNFAIQIERPKSGSGSL